MGASSRAGAPKPGLRWARRCCRRGVWVTATTVAAAGAPQKPRPSSGASSPVTYKGGRLREPEHGPVWLAAPPQQQHGGVRAVLGRKEATAVDKARGVSSYRPTARRRLATDPCLAPSPVFFLFVRRRGGEHLCSQCRCSPSAVGHAPTLWLLLLLPLRLPAPAPGPAATAEARSPGGQCPFDLLPAPSVPFHEPVVSLPCFTQLTCSETRVASSPPHLARGLPRAQNINI